MYQEIKAHFPSVTIFSLHPVELAQSSYVHGGWKKNVILSFLVPAGRYIASGLLTRDRKKRLRGLLFRPWRTENSLIMPYFSVRMADGK